MAEFPPVTLPGGVRLTFDGYLPARTCPRCGVRQQAAAYVKGLRYKFGQRWLSFKDTCLTCEPPVGLPGELHAVRLETSYRNDDGRLVGWRQRNKAGLFGEVLPLEQIGLRLTADGVWRPQPKLVRKSAAALAASPPLF